MAEKIVLEAAKRSVTGKEVRYLRAEGVVPGVLYGPMFDAIPLQVPWISLRPVLLEAGGSHIIQLNVGGEEYNALVRDVQRDPLRGDVLHIDFYRVRMDVAVRTDIPVVTVGAAPIITDLGGTVNQEMNSISVECLPGDLPAHVEVDLSVLKAIGDHILVRDLPQFPGVTYHAPADDIVVYTSYLRVQEEEVEAAATSEAAEPELVRRRPDEEEGEEV